MLDVHGGLDLRELRGAGIDLTELIDFSANMNPFGPSPRVQDALVGFDSAVYPDRHALELRHALAMVNGVSLTTVLVGNGTSELIWLAAHAFIKAGDSVILVGPTFGEYERAALAVGARVIRVRAAAPDFLLDVDRLLREIEGQHPRLVFLCNPNNPTGLYLEETIVRRIAMACTDGVLILDEAYRAFVADSRFGPPPAPRTVVLRSMTKDFALAGLRLGYALAEPEVLESMRAFQPPWSVNGLAQATGVAALNDLSHLEHTLELTHRSAESLRAALIGTGASVVRSPAHFLLIDVGKGHVWRRRLMDEGCLVRDCASFGLPQYVRVAARRPHENEKLVRAWSRLCSHED